ncbi:MAG: multicopper oxidase [Edaphobacter sp.]|uniref:multicopper oxidase family protein n=1 Tax=Edaphobacter sp. TaxID=1934404 RepID=UPI0023A3FCDC|nr:multicopper oxidase [Edaphobacter sp.]MDE1178704.1 multicopper oxidase [Edaphobacter sp.]
MFSRRRFIQRGGALATGLTLGRKSWARGFAGEPAQLIDATKLAPFVDPLPILPFVRSGPTRPDPNDSSRRIPYYHVSMDEVEVQLHRDLKTTRIWGFNGSSPGPVFEVQSGRPVVVEWSNHLPKKHLFPIDYSLHGAEHDKPDCRSVIHLHGGRTPSESDGYPENWMASGKSQSCYYPNRQDAAALYYHDHAMGISRLNVYAGLHGLYLVRDESEASLKLPRGKYEVPLVLCDRMVGTGGQLLYPVSNDAEHPWVPEVRGNVILANGKIKPYLEVEPIRYRLRVVNGSNGQTFNLALSGGIGTMYIIGSDQGLLPKPVAAKSVLLAPAERADVIIDFTEFSGQKVILQNDGAPVMQFRVKASDGRDDSYLPPSLQPMHRLVEADKTRRLTIDATGLAEHASLNRSTWATPVTEKPVQGSTEIWEIVNLTDRTHPVHLHMVRFQVLDRRGFDVALFKQSGELRYIAPPNHVAAEEAGWKDTVRCERGQVTRIIVPFTPYSGRYVWHSHLLEQEDRGMMRPYEIVPS